MKAVKSILGSTSLLFLMLTLIQSGNANAFMVRAQGVVTSNLVQATFCNNAYDVPMRCTALAYGQLNTGLWIHQETALHLIPGQCEFASVYANFPFLFVNGYAVGNCQLAY